MRFQEYIFDKDREGNKISTNVSMSSNIFIFVEPNININGAGKINCGDVLVTYESDINDEINLTITLSDYEGYENLNLRYFFEIYKLDKKTNKFTSRSFYKSPTYGYDDIQSIIEVKLPVKGLNFDGDFLIKNYFIFDYFSEFNNSTLNTRKHINRGEYGFYNGVRDFHFTGILKAEKPYFNEIYNIGETSGSLITGSIIPEEGSNEISMLNGVNGDVLVTLNGSVMSEGFDYVRDNDIIRFNDTLLGSDTITLSYSSSNDNFLHSDIIDVVEIGSGPTNNEGEYKVYYNEDTDKYELFLDYEPDLNTDIILSLNGVKLASEIDYTLSISNNKRVIFEGVIYVGDLINVTYFPLNSSSSVVTSSTPTIPWRIKTPPSSNNGRFILEVSLNKNFTNIYYENTIQHKIGVTIYSDILNLGLPFNTKLYYRVRNIKEYENICGDIITSENVSEIRDITLGVNPTIKY